MEEFASRLVDCRLVVASLASNHAVGAGDASRPAGVETHHGTVGHAHRLGWPHSPGLVAKTPEQRPEQELEAGLGFVGVRYPTPAWDRRTQACAVVHKTLVDVLQILVETCLTFRQIQTRLP